MGVRTLFNQPEEPRYVTESEIGSLLDSLMAEKLEAMYYDILGKARLMVQNGEITL